MEKAGSGTDTLLYPCLYPEYFFWSSAPVFAGISHRIAYLAFLELTTPLWWLWVDRSMTPPPGRGSWEPLLYGIHQMQLRNKKRRRELGNLIKRFRSGAESLPDAVILTTEEGGFSGVTALLSSCWGYAGLMTVARTSSTYCATRSLPII